MISRLIDINQLAALLHVAKGTLYNWIYLRKIPFVKLGRAVRFDPEKVSQILREVPIMEKTSRGWKGQ